MTDRIDAPEVGANAPTHVTHNRYRAYLLARIDEAIAGRRLTMDQLDRIAAVLEVPASELLPSHLPADCSDAPVDDALVVDDGERLRFIRPDWATGEQWRWMRDQMLRWQEGYAEGFTHGRDVERRLAEQAGR